jgi:hypothetical protein
MAEFFLKILVPGQLSSRQVGERFFHLILRYFPHALPERFGRFEPLKNKFDPGNLTLALDLWGTGSFIAQRRHPVAYFMVSFWPATSKKPSHSAISFFNLESDAKSVYGFVTEAFEAFEADYALAHPLTRIELEDRIEQIRERTEKRPFLHVELSDRLKKKIERNGYIGLTKDQLVANIDRAAITAQGGRVAEQELRRLRGRAEKEGFANVLSKMLILNTNIENCLPGLFWLNVFGPPYVELFGRGRLLSASVAHIGELTNGVVIRISEQLEDDAVSWSEFKTRRALCRNHLNSDAFFDSSARAGYRYRTPNFVFGR